MADYKDIKGGTIQNFAGDPPAPIAGQVWYDNAAAVFQFRAVNPAGAWATGNNMNTARSAVAGCGTQTAALVVAGQSPSKANAEKYDGTSWTEVADVNTARQDLGGSGTQTAAIVFGGEPRTAIAESWDNSSWTEVGDLNTGRYGLGGNSIGTSTAALAVGGLSPNVPVTNNGIVGKRQTGLPIGKIYSFNEDKEIIEEDDIEEAVSYAGAVGSYDTPGFADSEFMGTGKGSGKKGSTHSKTAYPGGKFVKIKDRCRKFPYCNQSPEAIKLYSENKVFNESRILKTIKKSNLKIKK